MSKFRRVGRLIAASTTSALVLSGVAVANAQEQDLVTISVSNFTDFHGRLLDDDYNEELGAAKLATLINYVNEGADIAVNTTSGDNVGGSAFVSAISNDIYTMEALNEMGIDVSAAGNHEFDQGFTDLQDRIKPASDFPILGANVYYEDGTRALPASHVITDETSGVKIGFVGTTSVLTPQKVDPTALDGIEIRNANAEANAEAKRLKDSGEADVVILLQHDDAEADNPGIDANYIDFHFGGDSHQQYLNLDAAAPYAQSLEYGKLVTDVDITYNPTTGEIVEVDAAQYGYEDFDALGLTPDPVVAETVAQAEAEAEVLGAEVVATIDQDFYRGSNPGAGPGSNRGTESTANNMLAESNLQAMNAFLKEDVAELGLMNAGGVRADLESGEVTYAEAFEIQPFGNELSYATMSGQAILDAMERQWQDYIPDLAPGARPRLSLGVSDNVSYAYNPEAEFGERITHVTINGEPLDPARDYTVATATFLFNGGDGFINPDDVRDQVNVGYMDVTAFSDYLASGEASVRTSQGEVGVVLPEGGLKAGETNTIELSSLNYSTDGEPMAETVTLNIGGTEVSADIDNTVTEADTGFGEQGRATIEIELPAEISGEQTLTVTTDQGTNVTMPVQVAEAADQTPAPTAPEPAAPANSAAALSSNPIMAAIIGLAAVLGLGGIIALLFPYQIDAALTNLF